MKSAAPTLVRIFVTLQAAVATIAQVAYLDALSWHKLGLTTPMGAQMRPPFLTLVTAHASVSVVAAGLAVTLVLYEGSSQAAARGLGLALAAWSYLTAYSGVTVLLRPDPGLTRVLFEGHFLLVEIVGLVGLLRFTALFPKPLTEQPLAPPSTHPAVLKPFHVASVWLLRPGAPWLAGLVIVTALWTLTAAHGLPIGDAGLSPLMDVVRFGSAGFVVMNLRRSWARATSDSDEVERLTWLLVALVWLLGALVLFIGGNVLVAVTGWQEPALPWRPLLTDLGLLGFVVGLAMAVLYRGRLRSARALRRVAALSAVIALGLFLAAGLEELFSGGVLAGFSLSTGVGTVIAFAVVVSTHRGLLRSLERLLAQMPVPGIAEEGA